MSDGAADLRTVDRSVLLQLLLSSRCDSLV